MRWPRFRGGRRDLDQAVAAAKDRETEAGDELAVSKARYTAIRDQVVDPLIAKAEVNHFAELIRRHLREGYQ